MEDIILISCILLLLLFILIMEYQSKYKELFYHIPSLSEDQLSEMGLALVHRETLGFFKSWKYSFKNIEIHVIKRRGTFQVKIGKLDIYKNGEFICEYYCLSKKFKTQIYKQYLRVRYPNTFGKWIKYESENINVNEKVKMFMEKEDLIYYIKENIT